MSVVWQDHAPDNSVRYLSDNQWIFIDESNGAPEPFNPEHIISSGLNQILLLYPGAITKDEDSKLTFEQLAVTGNDRSGTVPTMRLRRRQTNPRAFDWQRTTGTSYIVAAHVHGTLPPDDLAVLKEKMTGAEDPADAQTEQDGDAAESAAKGNKINAVVVPDIDWIIPDFFMIRQSGDREFLPATQNVTFILNIIDALAGDDRFTAIRKRTRAHRTLTKIDKATEDYRNKAIEEQETFAKEIEDEIAETRKRFDEQIKKVEQREDLSQVAKEQLINSVRFREQDKLNAELKALESRRSRKVKQISYEMEQDIRTVQDLYKLFAILIPPIPPLLVALYVFFRRREAEREGIAQSRLK